MGRNKIWSEASINCEWPTWIKLANILILLAVSDDTLIIVLAVIATSAVIESFSNK